MDILEQAWNRQEKQEKRASKGNQLHVDLSCLEKLVHVIEMKIKVYYWKDANVIPSLSIFCKENVG